METIIKNIITNIVALKGAEYITGEALMSLTPEDIDDKLQDLLMVVSVCSMINASVVSSMLYTCGLTENDLPDFSAVMDTESQEETNRVADGFVDDLVRLSMSRFSNRSSPTIN